MVQWLRFHIPNAGDAGLIPAQGSRSYLPQLKDALCYNLVAQRVKHLPAMQETSVRSLDQEDPLEKEMATYSRILAWEIP